jgi:hypothetical protein
MDQPELFKMAHEVGLSHQDVLNGIEFFGLERTTVLIKSAHAVGYSLEFKRVPSSTPKKETLTYRLFKKT